MAAYLKTLSGVTEFGIYEMSALRKTTLEEWGGVYAGVRATPTPQHIPILFSRLAFFQWSHEIIIARV
jgi:hypothetical protein